VGRHRHRPDVNVRLVKAVEHHEAIGARTIEFPGASSRDPAPLPEPFDECIPGVLAETVSDYVKRLFSAS